ncbi:MAG: hypothetical protein HYU00_05480, partial [Nitrosarchaeum sp.]|nr:hypothetical protein [Nitrosarchaeum sp.]
MSDRINYKDAEIALEEFLDSSYSVSHSNATVRGYRSAIVSNTNGFRKFLRERCNCDEIQLCEQIAKGKADV